jgi:hypothetical protein
MAWYSSLRARLACSCSTAVLPGWRRPRRSGHTSARRAGVDAAVRDAPADVGDARADAPVAVARGEPLALGQRPPARRRGGAEATGVGELVRRERGRAEAERGEAEAEAGGDDRRVREAAAAARVAARVAAAPHRECGEREGGGARAEVFRCCARRARGARQRVFCSRIHLSKQ